MDVDLQEGEQALDQAMRARAKEELREFMQERSESWWHRSLMQEEGRTAATQEGYSLGN